MSKGRGRFGRRARDSQLAAINARIFGSSGPPRAPRRKPRLDGLAYAIAEATRPGMGKRRLRWTARAALAGAILAATLVFAGQAFAVHDLGLFELYGNATSGQS